MLPAEYLTVNDLPGDNSPDDSIPEEQEEVQEARRPRRAVAAKSKPEKKTKGRLLLKQTLSKEKIKKGVAGKTNVLKTGKREPKKATKAKGKIKEKQVVARKTRVSKSKVSEAKGKRGQKVSIGFVEEDSLVNTPRVLHNSPAASTTTAKTSVYINQKNNSHLDVSEEQVVDNLDVDVNVSAVKSSRKDKLPARDSSSSNRKPNKQKGGKGSKGASNKESFRDDEKEVSAVVDSDPVPVNDDMPMLSHSNLRRSQLARTMQSPQGSCTPFSATPGSEFTLTRREEMLRSGVSFRHQKMAQSGKKSTSRNSSRTSGKGDTEVCSENDFDAGHDKDDKVDYEDDDGGGGDDVDDDDSDDDGNDLPQDMMDDVSLDVQESSVGQQNTSTKGQLSGTKSRLSLASAVVSKSCPSPANLTPCLVTPGRKSLSKGRRVTISHQVTEAVYDVPSDLSSSDSPVSSKTSQRSSIPGGDMTTYISMSSTPIHVCERTTTETPKPFQKPEKCKIIIPDPSPPNGLRRSHRTRVQTLEWYKNERVDYQYRKSGGFVVAGIIPSQEAKILEKEQQRRTALKKARSKHKKRRNNGESPPRNLSMHTEIPSDMNLTVSDEIPVVNPETDEEVYVECFASKDSGVFVGPSGKPPTPEDPFVMSRTLDQKGFGTGVLLLRPLQEKTIQMVSRGTLIFLLERGAVTLTIHRASVVMEAGDSAFVPRGNTYSMKNLRSEEAKFSYTVLKEA